MSLTLEKIFEAKNRIAPYTTRTPLIRLEKLDEYLGCQVYLKAECMQITGAFKLRGAVNKIRMLTPEQLSCGIVAASSGNHGRAVAYTAKKLGAKATIVMPYTVPAIKVNAIKELGAEVVQCETSERFDVAERSAGRKMRPWFRRTTTRRLWPDREPRESRFWNSVRRSIRSSFRSAVADSSAVSQRR